MRGLAIISGALALMLTAGAAQGQAWFGVPTPGPLSPVDKPTFATNADAYGPIPAPPGLRPKDDITGALKGPRMFEDVKTIVGFSLERRDAGDPLWGRISGLPGEAKAVEWAVAQLKAAGLKDAHSETYVSEAPLWLPRTWEVRLKADGSPDVVLASAVPVRNPTTKPTSAVGPLIFAGRGSPAELANLEVKGKVAVIDVVPEDSLFAAREKGVARELEKRGAIGVINAVESPGNLLYYDNRYGCDAIPCFLTGGDDGAFLESVIGKAAAKGQQVRASLSLTSETRSNLPALNGVATIPGKSREIVIVNAHADAWWTGANDNADGLSVMLGLARYYAHRKEKPARTLLFMVSGGHHTGNGPAAFIRDHPDLIARTVLVMNLEHLAQIAVPQAPRLDPAGPGGYGSGVWTANTSETTKMAGAANSTPYVWARMGKAAKRYGVVTSFAPSTSAPGDLGAYIRAGLPSAQLISSEVYYHSSGDTVPTISVPGLERAAAYYAGFIDDVAKAPRDKLKGAAPAR